MNKKLESFFKIVDIKNINQGILTFNKVVQDFGASMNSIAEELSSDIEKFVTIFLGMVITCMSTGVKEIESL